MSLREWLRNGWLVEHRTSPQEITDLFRLVNRDLKDCHIATLSTDWRLSIAYNAALQAATAALAASGYRAAREAHHYRIIQSLTFTIEAEPLLIAQLDQFRKKRNISDYEQAGAVSEQEVKEMVALAKSMRQRVESWLRAHHPHLLKRGQAPFS